MGIFERFGKLPALPAEAQSWFCCLCFLVDLEELEARSRKAKWRNETELLWSPPWLGRRSQPRHGATELLLWDVFLASRRISRHRVCPVVPCVVSSGLNLGDLFLANPVQRNAADVGVQLTPPNGGTSVRFPGTQHRRPREHRDGDQPLHVAAVFPVTLFILLGCFPPQNLNGVSSCQLSCERGNVPPVCCLFFQLCRGSRSVGGACAPQKNLVLLPRPPVCVLLGLINISAIRNCLFSIYWGHCGYDSTLA